MNIVMLLTFTKLDNSVNENCVKDEDQPRNKESGEEANVRT